MNVDITAIEQRYSLADQRAQSYLVFSLPSGREISVEISEDEAAAVIEANLSPQQLGHEIPVIEGTTHSELEKQSWRAAESSVTKLVEWMTVPDDVLPAVVKAEFLQQQLPPMMTVEEVSTRAREILNAPVVAMGVVERNVRLPGQGRFVAPRIESDEAGNPVVQPMDQDPGEIVDEETGARSV